jgi:hypothetical protein
MAVTPLLVIYIDLLLQTQNLPKNRVECLNCVTFQSEL